MATRNLKQTNPLQISEVGTKRLGVLNTPDDFVTKKGLVKDRFGNPSREEIIDSIRKLRESNKQESPWTRN